MTSNTKLKSPQVSPSARLGLEILEILYSKMILDTLVPDADDAFENLRRMKLIHVLYDDIVIRLCKIIDRNRTSLGGPRIIRGLRNSGAAPDRIRRAEEALADLQLRISRLESYRHTRVAHIGSTEPGSLEPHPPLGPALKAAVAFADAITGTKNRYCVMEVDLRVVVLGESAG